MQNTIQISDIEKWLSKIETFMQNVEILDPRGEEMIANINAYVNDSRHFQEQGNLVLSFECMVWAWSVLEVCQQLGVISAKDEPDRKL